MPNGIRICWIKSASEDVGVHRLLRKDPSSQNWVEVKMFLNHDSTCFVDRPKYKNLYQYRLLAEDSAQHQTSSSEILVKRIENGNRPPIENIKTEVNRDEKKIILKWEYKGEEVAKYLVYRSSANESLTLVKSIFGNRNLFEDKNIYPNSNYHYAIKCVFSDGAESVFSKLVDVFY
jgi:hypothetical protein